MSHHTPPPAPIPAQRPERNVDVQPEDIKLGDVNIEGSGIKKKGKRSLQRPTGAPKSGLNI